MKIALASDHGGYALKCDIKALLEKLGHQVEDFGCHSTDSCDYPDFGEAAARAVAAGTCDRGIVICTTGIGISIAANKVRGIRCAHCADSLQAEMTRRHNDANMMANWRRLYRQEHGRADGGGLFDHRVRGRTPCPPGG
jgi:ribose 5-phosphate isomerase B